MNFKPFLYLLLIDLGILILIFLISTQQQGGGQDVEFLVIGIEYQIKAHLLAVLLIPINYKWAKKNIVFVLICILIGLIPFILKYIL